MIKVRITWDEDSERAKVRKELVTLEDLIKLHLQEMKQLHGVGIHMIAEQSKEADK